MYLLTDTTAHFSLRVTTPIPRPRLSGFELLDVTFHRCCIRFVPDQGNKSGLLRDEDLGGNAARLWARVSHLGGKIWGKIAGFSNEMEFGEIVGSSLY